MLPRENYGDEEGAKKDLELEQQQREKTEREQAAQERVADIQTELKEAANEAETLFEGDLKDNIDVLAQRCWRVICLLDRAHLYDEERVYDASVQTENMLIPSWEVLDPKQIPGLIKPAKTEETK